MPRLRTRFGAAGLVADNGVMAAKPAGPKARDLNQLIRYTMWSVFRVAEPGFADRETAAAEVSELLDAAGVAHAFVDVDSLRWCYPRPPDDRFRTVLAMRNLAAIWPNFRVYGATHLILADVLEARADLARYEAAVPSATITVVRLRAPLETLIARVQQRERGSALDRQIQRVTELAAKMDRDQVEDLLVETDGKSVTTIAREVLGRIGWLPEGLREH